MLGTGGLCLPYVADRERYIACRTRVQGGVYAGDAGNRGGVEVSDIGYRCICLDSATKPRRYGKNTVTHEC